MSHRIYMLISVIGVGLLACGPCPPEEEPDGGAPTPMCDEHPELAQIESIACAIDADCPVITACVTIVCGPSATCVFGASPPNGAPCEAGGACDDRRCCHPVPVTP